MSSDHSYEPWDDEAMAANAQATVTEVWRRTRAMSADKPIEKTNRQRIAEAVEFLRTASPEVKLEILRRSQARADYTLNGSDDDSR